MVLLGRLVGRRPGARVPYPRRVYASRISPRSRGPVSTNVIPREELRAAREAAGLSRAELAALAETTQHYVWVAEMPPFSPMDAGVLNKIVKVLGGATEASPAPPVEEWKSTVRGTSWVCERCGETMHQPGTPNAVAHICRKNHGKLTSMKRIP